MKKIYFILTHTGTMLSKLIKVYTKDEFSHVSISLDAELKQMYSFGRLKPYNPFIGGFIHEFVDKGTFKRFYRTKAKIYSLEVTESQYKLLKENIEKIEREKENYKFNIIGLIAAGLHKKIKFKKSFYCAEFIKYIMEKAKIPNNLPDIVKPEHFKNIEGVAKVYSGTLRKYKWFTLNIQKPILKCSQEQTMMD